MSASAPSGHLLRTLAAVPPGTRVVVVACGEGVHAEPLARLGFDVWACDADDRSIVATRQRLAEVVGEDDAECRVTHARADALGYPDAFAGWVVLDGDAVSPAVLTETARVVAPGGWVWTETETPDALLDQAEAAGLLLAEAPATEPGRTRAHVILRREGGIA